MEIDDPRLVQAREKMSERIEKYNERMLTVIKNHLAVEQSLNDLLAAASRRWKRRTFRGKVDVAKSLLLQELHDHVWPVLEAGNDLRNAVAHGDKYGKVEERLVDFRKAYLSVLSPQQRKGVEEMNEVQLVTSAFCHCGSFLVVAADRLADEKKK
jgi:hypothetical protein